MIPILFVAFATLLVVCSLMVVLHRSPISSALFLVLAFCALAGIYLLLHAEFVAMVQIIVYAGAIMVLFLFVIMYLNLKRDVERGVHIALRRGVGWAIGITLLVEGWVLLARRWAPGPESSEAAAAASLGNAQAVGQLLYTRYLFPFEITSMVLLVAMIGAVVIARGRVPHLAHQEPRSPAVASGGGADAASAPEAAPLAPRSEDPA